YLPATETMYWASTSAGAWRGQTAIRTSDRDHLSGATLAGPTSWMKSPHMAKLDVVHHGYVPSLAYRIAMVADNLVDGAIARPGAHDWDLAAADLLVHEAGGRLTGLDGQALRYNGPALRHEMLVAGSHYLHGPLIDIVQRVFDDKQAGQSQPATTIRNR
ncbi:MAG: inositol monophosphatase family protein, partial [Alphaproteobacteria bacterium]